MDSAAAGYFHLVVVETWGDDEVETPGPQNHTRLRLMKPARRREGDEDTDRSVDRHGGAAVTLQYRFSAETATAVTVGRSRSRVASLSTRYNDGGVAALSGDGDNSTEALPQARTRFGSPVGSVRGLLLLPTDPYEFVQN